MLRHRLACSFQDGEAAKPSLAKGTPLRIGMNRKDKNKVNIVTRLPKKRATPTLWRSLTPIARLS